MAIQPGVGYTFSASSQGENLTIEQPWAPIALLQQAADPDHPFKVRAVFGENATDLRIYVTAGTINNIVPAIYGGNPTDPLLNAIPQPYSVIAGGAFSVYDIYIRSGKSEDNQFPSPNREDSGYPQVWYEPDPTGPKADTDTYGYICLARVTVDNEELTVTEINQYVTGSLWVSRIKVGTLTAKYYYARI